MEQLTPLLEEHTSPNDRQQGIVISNIEDHLQRLVNTQQCIDQIRKKGDSNPGGGRGSWHMRVRICATHMNGCWGYNALKKGSV